MLYEGFSAVALAEKIGAVECHTFASLPSTLDIVHQLAGQGAPAGIVVLADEQLKGRGTRGRSWYSPPGRGIWLGYLYRSTTPASGILSIRVGLALADALEDLDVESGLKWPNDLMIGELKAAGVLCEARTGDSEGWIAIGVGVNVYGPIGRELMTVATTLDTCAADINRVAVLERFVPRLRRLESSEELTRAEVEHFSRRNWLGGRTVTAPVPGRAIGIDSEGALNIDSDGTLERIFGGSVAVV
jgi:BirA family transcriptional regulator, biotin operon repressor / biotin---[acetyl-CoA-carboxylase] ligase